MGAKSAMTKVAGLDVGYSRKKRSSGTATLVDAELRVGHHFVEDARADIARHGPYEVIAIDGPIIPENGDHKCVRGVERVFASGPFQRRCKPAFSNVPGTGLKLRRAAGGVADGLRCAAPLDGRAAIPLVRRARIVEAFPNTFLGVCLSDVCYADMPKSLKRGKKFGWLYDRWIKHDVISRLPQLPERDMLRSRFQATSNRDERAALVCLLTALLVSREAFTAVGDDAGGWFFLPPWDSWEEWARDAVRVKCEGLDRAGSRLRIVKRNPSA